MRNRRRGLTLIELLVLLGSAAVVAAILLPMLARRPRDARRSACQMNLKYVGLGFMQYTQDNGERFPPVASSPAPSRLGTRPQFFGWADSLQPYIKSTQLFQCPQEPHSRESAHPTQSAYSDYWFNARMARLSVERLGSPATTFLGGDGEPGSARNAISAWPQSWIARNDSPLSRHNGFTNILWADGHVKALKDYRAARLNGFDPYGKEPRGE